MNRLAAALLCGSSLLAGTSTLAQPTSNGQSGEVRGLEEIVVTARKREETLQNVPVAVSAVAGDQLRRALASDLSKVAELAPQVSIGAGGSGTGAVITVRGVSSAASDAGLQQSVAIEFDGVPLSRGSIVSAALFDIQQVQVLQGPQALFFGKNSPAGVISFQSADPTDSFEGFVTAGHEFEARQWYSEGAVSGPLAEGLSGRLAYRVSDMRGWMKNVAAPTTDFVNSAVSNPGAADNYNPGNQDTAFRGTLLWRPASDFTANLKVTYNDQQRTTGNGNSEPYCLAPTTSPVFLGTRPLAPSGSDCRKDRVTAQGGVAPIYAANVPYSNGGVPYFQSKIGMSGLTMTKEFQFGSLTSTTGYYHQVTEQNTPTDWSAYAAVWAAGREKYEVGSQELRFDSKFDGMFNFMVGAYFEQFSRNLVNSPDIFHTFNPQASNYASVTLRSRENGDYLSAFAQARINLRSNLELSGGARWSSDQKNISIVNLEVGPAYLASLYPRGVRLNSRFKDKHVSPEATLTWHPDSDQTLYVAFKTGYKGGGISNPFLVQKTATPSSLQFQPEEAKGFEAGYKATMFDRRLRFDLAAYSYRYSNLQVVSYDASTISFTLQNAAQARIKGVQGSATWLAAEGLIFRGNFGYNSSKYTRFTNAPCYPGQTAATGCFGTPAAQDLSGKALLRAPKLTYSLGAEYHAALSDNLDSTWTVQGSHTSSYQAATDYAPGGFQKSYWILNASIAVATADNRYEVALLGRNLTNSYYLLQTFGWTGAGNPNQYAGFFNRPREIALQGSVRW